MIVDVGLPGMSGIELCTRLRGLDVDTPILILRREISRRSRRRSASGRRRLPGQAVLARRPGRKASRAAPPVVPAAGRSQRRCWLRTLWIDLDRRVATVDDSSTDLSRREFDLLAVFVANPGIVLSRIRLLEMVWGYDFDVDTNVVDVFVGYVRRKLDAAGAIRLIDTVRGVGFVLEGRLMRLATRSGLAAFIAASITLLAIGALFRGQLAGILQDRVDKQLGDRPETAPVLAAVAGRLAHPSCARPWRSASRAWRGDDLAGAPS